MKNMMKEAEEVDLFSSVLSMSWDFIFYTAQVFCESRRNIKKKARRHSFRKRCPNPQEFYRFLDESNGARKRPKVG